MKRAVIVSFTGIDGSGKTTLAKSLKKYLDELGIPNAYLWCGWRGFESPIFKPVSRLLRGITKEIKHKKENRTVITHKLGILTFPAVLDYLFRVYPKLIVSVLTKDIIITDRYIHDVIVAFLAIEDQFSAKLFRTLSLIFPQPWKIVYIDVPTEIAYARKNDIQFLEYLLRQKEIYPKILKNYNNVVILDGTSPKESLIRRIKEEVLEWQKN